jgi:hypothetical protein
MYHKTTVDRVIPAIEAPWKRSVLGNSKHLSLKKPAERAE